jgi:hypothetical protein
MAVKSCLIEDQNINLLSCNVPYFVTLICLMPDNFNLLVNGEVLGVNS